MPDERFLIFTYTLEELGKMQETSPDLEPYFKMAWDKLEYALPSAMDAVLRDKQLACVYSFNGHHIKRESQIWRNRFRGVSVKHRDGEAVQVDMCHAIQDAETHWMDIDHANFDLSKVNIHMCGYCEGHGGWGRGGDDIHMCEKCGGLGWIVDEHMSSTGDVIDG